MGAGASSGAPFASEAEALRAGKTPAQIKKWKEDQQAANTGFQWKETKRCLCCPRVDSRRLPLMTHCAELKADLLEKKGIVVSQPCLDERSGVPRKFTFPLATPCPDELGQI